AVGRGFCVDESSSISSSALCAAVHSTQFSSEHMHTFLALRALSCLLHP
uniref:Secreted protein n=1 Tax=Parascaris univalens TaxID=6257 RepID=A0A915AAU2_PARUN